jgi:PKD repeat protein
VVASGSAPSGVDAMQIYLDGVRVYQINASSFDTTVPGNSGTHAVVVKLWDKLGNAYVQTVTVNVIPRLVTALSLSASSIVPGGSVQATLSATSGAIGSSFINWGDGTTSSGSSATHAYANAGTYTITGTAADAVAQTTASATLTVQKAFVMMQSPTTNSNVSTSVHVQGYASAPSGIVAMQIYLDGNLIYRNSLSQVDTFINVSVGTHRITLKAWDGSGAAYMQQAYVTAN